MLRHIREPLRYKPYRLVVLGAAFLLTSCGVPSPARPTLNSLSVRSAFPEVREATIHPAGRLANLPISTIVQALGPGSAVFSVLADPADPSRWMPGLYELNFQTGHSTQLLRLTSREEIKRAAISGSWVAFELSSPKGSALKLLNTTSHHCVTIFRPISPWSAVGEPMGLSFHDGSLYWVSNMTGPQGLVSRLYQYHLPSQRLTTPLTVSSNAMRRFVVAATPSANGLWLSVNEDTHATQTTTQGELWFWSYAHRRVTQRVSVPHAPVDLYGATDHNVIFSGNVTPLPASRRNPEPFPLYALNWSEHRVEQLTRRSNPGGQATVSPPYVSVNGLGLTSAVVNLQTMRAITLPTPRAAIGPGWLVWQSAHTLSWAPYP